MKPKHWDLVKTFQGYCNGQVNQFLITGGVALNLYGLVQDDDIGDLDIILINPTEDLIKMFKNLESITPVKDRSPYVAELNENLIRFELKGVNVDIFIEREVKSGVLWFDYVQINPLRHILTAKKRQNRRKDLQFLCDLIKDISTL